MRTTGGKVVQEPGEAIDILGGNTKVAKWLQVETGTPDMPRPNTVATWRERGISRNFAVHFYAELVERRGLRLAPQVFGLDSWDHVLMPDKRRRKLTRVD